MGWITDFLLFLFPVNCLVCGKRLSAPTSVLCVPCEFKLPRTGYSDRPDNPVSMLFWGRVPIQGGTSLYRFEKGSAYQVLLHELKYRGNRKVGTYLGILLGKAITGTCYSACDLLIPVPIHKKRLRKRGYNQSEVIAEGISAVTGIPLNATVLARIRSHVSQTSKGRYERFENVQGNIQLTRDPPDLNGLKILLIDDVVTTGATLEACCQALLERYDCQLYVSTVSCA
jgi:ComF family protein